jgi:hypothetical protein
MVSPRRFGRWLAFCVLGSSGAALAQQAPYDPAIDVQTFEYAIGPKTFVTVSDADVAAHRQLAADALITFLTKPFTIYDLDEDRMISGERVRVVESLTAAQLTAAYGVSDRLQIGANLPVIFTLRGEGLEPDTGTSVMGGLHVTGIGDLVVEGKYRLYRKQGAKIAVLAAVSLPSSVGSGGSQFIGDDLPELRARVALQYDRDWLAVGANAGALLRKPRTIYDSTIGPQLAWSVGAAVRITGRLSAIAESYGRAGLPDFSLDASPLEAIGALRLYATSAVAVLAGGGAGLVKGIGAPESRFFLSVGYAPDVRDSDGDGTPNGRDRCPTEPEDRDGFQDGDGCPDEDNDGDHRPDAADRCPEQAEDIDGFDDDDGCPELDNDRDGFPDLAEKCPLEPEDGKPPFPKDGCPFREAAPEPPPEPEPAPEPTPDDAGAAAAAHCPDPDGDRDGIPDAADTCPAQAETINGVADGDGCPDTGGMTVARLDGDRLVIARVPGIKGVAALTPAGAIIVDQVALVIRSHPEATKWLLAVAQPKAAVATRLAELIAARLAEKGVPAERVQVLGAAGPAKIGGVVQERADAGPGCPAP